MPHGGCSSSQPDESAAAAAAGPAPANRGAFGAATLDAGRGSFGRYTWGAAAAAAISLAGVCMSDNKVIVVNTQQRGLGKPRCSTCPSTGQLAPCGRWAGVTKSCRPLVRLHCFRTRCPTRGLPTISVMYFAAAVAAGVGSHSGGTRAGATAAVGGVSTVSMPMMLPCACNNSGSAYRLPAMLQQALHAAHAVAVHHVPLCADGTC